MNGMSIKIKWTRTIPAVCTEEHERHRSSAAVPGPGGHADGRGLDDVRPDRLGAVGPPVRPGRPARRGVAAAGLGRRHPGGLGAAAAVAVPAPDVAGRDRAWRRHGRGDNAVHGVGGPAAAWHRERAGVPGAAERGRRAQPGRPDAAVARVRRGRRAAADPAVAGRRGPRSGSPSRSARPSAGRATSCSPRRSATSWPACRGWRSRCRWPGWWPRWWRARPSSRS